MVGGRMQDQQACREEIVGMCTASRFPLFYFPH